MPNEIFITDDKVLFTWNDRLTSFILKKNVCQVSLNSVSSKIYIPSGKATGLAYIYTSVFVVITMYLGIQ